MCASEEARDSAGSPWQILAEEFLKPRGMTVNALALALRVPSNRLQAIVESQRAISPDTALRLGGYFAQPSENAPREAA
jgi:addiction module HigA family antidote